MTFLELTSADLSSLSDGDLRELVGRLCEAELTSRGLPTSYVTWGGAQEAPDGGLDVTVRSSDVILGSNFIPRANTGFQVKKQSMAKAACRAEMNRPGNRGGCLV